MIKAYASRTGTKVNLEALAAAGWGLLISAYGVHRNEGFADHMLDNGAWSAFTSGKPWESARFEQLLGQFGRTSAQTVAPDIVGGGLASLDLSVAWLPCLLSLGRPVLIPAQDGIDVEHMRPHLGESVGIAVGGSTEWKWRTLGMWCDLGREVGCRVHVLRANSARMISWAEAAGAYSFDGSGASTYSVVTVRLAAARLRPVQRVLPGLALPSPFKPRTPSPRKPR